MTCGRPATVSSLESVRNTPAGSVSVTGVPSTGAVSLIVALSALGTDGHLDVLGEPKRVDREGRRGQVQALHEEPGLPADRVLGGHGLDRWDRASTAMPAPTSETVGSDWRIWPSSSTTDTMTAWLSPCVTNTTSGLAVISRRGALVPGRVARAGQHRECAENNAPTLQPLHNHHLNSRRRRLERPRCVRARRCYNPLARSSSSRSRFRYSAMSSSAGTPRIRVQFGSPTSFTSLDFISLKLPTPLRSAKM